MMIKRERREKKNGPYKLKNCYDPLNILEAAHLLLYWCSGAKIIMFRNAFSWAKNTARGVRFLLGFNMYLILAQC